MPKTMLDEAVSNLTMNDEGDQGRKPAAMPTGLQIGSRPMTPWSPIQASGAVPKTPTSSCNDGQTSASLGGQSSWTSNGNPSPVTGWPKRSPIQPHRNSTHDDASLSLLMGSFDTLSDTMKSPLYPRSVCSRDTDFSPIKLNESDESFSFDDPNGFSLEGNSEQVNKHPVENNRKASSQINQMSNFGSLPESNPSFSSMKGPPIPSDPKMVLRSLFKSFLACSYRLPCLFQSSSYGYPSQHREMTNSLQSPDDILIAVRRVETAICAFGGWVRPPPPNLAFSGANESTLHRAESHHKYQAMFHSRYAVRMANVSWDMEDDPPVEVPPGESKVEKKNDDSTVHSVTWGGESKQNARPESPVESVGSALASENTQKMKYKCKRCGMLKQNHDCPYAKSLQRSIGVTVHPHVNAFAAEEPGLVARPLSEMNNLVKLNDDKDCASVSTVRNTSLSFRRRVQVTPDKNASKKRKWDQFDLGVTPQVSFGSLPYLPALTQQTYPHVPLSLRERQRLSDTLYAASFLTNSTSEVAVLLHDARMRDEWDLAVAELLTQIVVSLHCTEKDYQLKGLQKYLLRLGLAC